MTEQMFEVRAFLPSSITAASGSPLAGVDAIFLKVAAGSASEAADNFFSRKCVQLDIPTVNESSGEVLFINPLACSGVIAYPIVLKDTDCPEMVRPSNKAHLRRVK